MSTLNPTAALRRWKFSIFIYMFVLAVCAATWTARTPAIRDILGASTSSMGLILLGLSVGSMTGVLSAGPLVARWGTKPFTLLGGALVTTSMLLLAFGAAIASASSVFAGLVCFGLAQGISEITINIDGAAIESQSDAPVLPALHGSFSIGVCAGALASLGAISLDLTPKTNFLIVALLAACASVGVAANLLPGVGKFTASERAESQGGTAANSAASHAGTSKTKSVWHEPFVWLLGLVLLGVALSEGAANDWLPLMLVDGLGAKPSQGSLVFAMFAGVMAAGRFAGQWLVKRFGKRQILLASVVTAAIGVAAASQGPNATIVVLGVLAWGLGAALGFPVVISIAGESTNHGAARVSAVATCGYFAFLVGPPLLGFVGQERGLRNAMLLVVGALVASTLAAAALLSGKGGGHPRH